MPSNSRPFSLPAKLNLKVSLHFVEHSVNTDQAKSLLTASLPRGILMNLRDIVLVLVNIQLSANCVFHEHFLNEP